MEPANDHFEKSVQTLYEFLEASELRATLTLADCSQQTLSIAKLRAYYLGKLEQTNTLLVNPQVAHDRLIEVQMPVEWNDKEKHIKHSFFVEIRVDDRIVYESYDL